MLAEPEIDVVGYVPMSPLTVVGPVFVIPAPASTEKLPAVPRETADGAAPALPVIVNTATTPSAKSPSVAATERRRRARKPKSKSSMMSFPQPS